MCTVVCVCVFVCVYVCVYARVCMCVCECGHGVKSRIRGGNPSPVHCEPSRGPTNAKRLIQVSFPPCHWSQMLCNGPATSPHVMGVMSLTRWAFCNQCSMWCGGLGGSADIQVLAPMPHKCTKIMNRSK